MTYYVERDYLAHHGIKGQKWGLRRFQNEDGSLTSAGKARYGDDDTDFERHSSNGKKNSASVRSKSKGQKKEKMSSEKKKQIAKKVLISAAAAGIVAGSLYLGSKHLKKMANGVLNKDYIMQRKSIMTAHTNATKHIKEIFEGEFNQNGYHRGTYALDRASENTHKMLKEAHDSYENTRKKVNKSAIEAYKYLKGKRYPR